MSVREILRKKTTNVQSEQLHPWLHLFPLAHLLRSHSSPRPPSSFGLPPLKQNCGTSKESVALTLSTNVDLAIECLGVRVATIVVKMTKRKFATSGISNFGSARDASTNGHWRALSFFGM